MRKEWKTMLGLSMAVGAATLTRAAYELTHFEIKRYDIMDRKIPESFNQTKLLFLTDLHNTEYGKKNARLLEAIDAENPDYIFIGGDMLVAKAEASFLPALSFVRKLAKKYPVYYANGNHEYRLKIYKEQYGKDTYDDYVNSLKAAGVTHLCNETVNICRQNQEIFVSGLEIEAMYYHRLKQMRMPENYIPSLLGRPREDRFHIMLAHNPYYFPQYARWGADLVLSGHVHGGIVRIPYLGGVISPQLTLFPEYDMGVFEKEDSQMILSAGLGVHSIPFRLFNMPQMQVITLYRECVEKM